MHPRNPYFIKKPDFVELAKKHAFLAPFVSLVRNVPVCINSRYGMLSHSFQSTTFDTFDFQESNKGRIDFKNKDALRALTRALLLEDFGLDVVIPLDSLVPMVPQRLNYILWIEDLIKDHSSEHCGLDIGREIFL
jgi:methyltransferase